MWRGVHGSAHRDGRSLAWAGGPNRYRSIQGRPHIQRGVRKRGDGRVYAHVPELPGVQAQGENLDEARAIVKDALALALEERAARAEAIPAKSWALVESVEIAA